MGSAAEIGDMVASMPTKNLLCLIGVLEVTPETCMLGRWETLESLQGGLSCSDREREDLSAGESKNESLIISFDLLCDCTGEVV